ncbi:hypothetical protein [Allofustis seminis]|uniref:hypothetical protein n=1 Tax=Allofustis seminis TaxID=166939 RepID=UPI000368A022|nr:hypothetical protein [Allofustis seminis]
MIIVNSPLMHDEIKTILAESTTPTFTFEKEAGIKLYFQTDHDDVEEAAAIAKKLIKEGTGNVLYFSVTTEEYM